MFKLIPHHLVLPLQALILAAQSEQLFFSGPTVPAADKRVRAVPPVLTAPPVDSLPRQIKPFGELVYAEIILEVQPHDLEFEFAAFFSICIHSDLQYYDIFIAVLKYYNAVRSGASLIMTINYNAVLLSSLFLSFLLKK
jgi:hypothetical protein